MQNKGYTHDYEIYKLITLALKGKYVNHYSKR